MAGQATRATAELDRAGASYQVHQYAVDEKVGEGYGEAVAKAIGMASDRVFKTLVAEVDDEVLVAVVPVARRLSAKKLAQAVEGKRCALASPATAERDTGYVPGGISPFGRRKRQPLVLDSSAFQHETIAVSGGRRGLQLELTPATLLEVTGGVTADIADEWQI
ncbi:MAG TPA: Cys-tRNA(Pro) deacylase [Acidimicrobiia bacterium]|nr:Cys-tRNA(Pro) deacylase [Acidimicrobiia bacterium]